MSVVTVSGRRGVKEQRIESGDILDSINAAKACFGSPCRKYAGALTIELIRRALMKIGIRVSRRDVFIQGVPLEIDFLVPGPHARLSNGLVYRPEDVLAIVEVKNAGSFGKPTIETIRQNFTVIRKANRRIRCCYLTVAERRGFRWAVTSRNSGGNAYTMFWHHGSGKNLAYDPSGDWDRFVADMRRIRKA